MSLVSHWEHEYDKVKLRLHGLFTRMEMAWMKLISELEPQEFQAIIKLLQRGHDQAQYVLKNGELPGDEPAVPWELSHGLSILRIGNAAPLPQSSDQLQTRVLKDGSLLGCRKWELLDLLWSEALLKWIENLRHHATFGTDPAVVQMERDVTLAIAGDWGTGPFDSHAPAVAVANQMQLAQADFTIHLGDVYYAGSHSQENVDMAGWPMGSHGSFTLNSNHEMYSGAHGYFKELAKRFPGQQGTSYFALINDDWLVVGLDSAYASDAMNLYMDGTLNEPQIVWMKGLPKRKNHGAQPSPGLRHFRAQQDRAVSTGVRCTGARAGLLVLGTSAQRHRLRTTGRFACALRRARGDSIRQRQRAGRAFAGVVVGDAGCQGSGVSAAGVERVRENQAGGGGYF